MPYRVLFVSAEYTPFSKTGGLADVSTALSRFLHDEGGDVRVFVPYYRDPTTKPEGLAPVDFLQDLVLELGPHRYTYRVLVGRAPGHPMPVYFVDCPALYDRPTIYGYADEHRRFLLLTRAAFECAQRMAFAPHILHCHDWHAAFGPLLLKTTYAWDRLFAATRSVLTIHNIGYQGTFPAGDAVDLALGDAQFLLHQDDLKAGHVNPLLHGILYADLITTVSPTYAREIRTSEFGAGLDPYLRARGERVVGILNGVDYSEWDPSIDPLIDTRYSREDLSGKRAVKRALGRETGLSLGPRTLLFGAVSRLVSQKGFDLIEAVLPDILAQHDCAFVALGSGDARHEEALTALQGRFPGRVVYQRGYSEVLAHRIEAAADAFLMPSRYEPCGLNQMYSLRYGTIPIVRRTGGLADSVRSYDVASRSGTGILFDAYDPAALSAAIRHAFTLWREPDHWQQMMRNAMSENYSWSRQGGIYIDSYRALVGPA